MLPLARALRRGCLWLRWALSWIRFSGLSVGLGLWPFYAWWQSKTRCMVGNLRLSQDSGLPRVGYNTNCAMIATAIGEGLIVRTLRMEIVWESCFIIQAWFIQFLLFRSDVDLADVTGRLTVMCRGPLLFISSRFIYWVVIYYISGERSIKSISNMVVYW